MGVKAEILKAETLNAKRALKSRAKPKLAWP
jgi:hypothetical protein